MTKDELFIFIGIILLMGVRKKLSIKMYFPKISMNITQFFSEAISKDWYVNIMYLNFVLYDANKLRKCKSCSEEPIAISYLLNC